MNRSVPFHIRFFRREVDHFLRLKISNKKNAYIGERKSRKVRTGLRNSKKTKMMR